MNRDTGNEQNDGWEKGRGEDLPDPINLEELPPEEQLIQWGLDELNLCEFPIAVLSDKAPRNRNTLVRKDRKWDPVRRSFFERQLTITTGDKWGFPTALDDELLLALIYITREQNGFTDRRVHFSRYDLVRLLGWNDHGRSYDRIKTGLMRWKALTLTYEQGWWDKGDQIHRTTGFSVLDNVDLFEKRMNQGRARQQLFLPISTFTWNEVIFKSFQDGYIKPIDMDVFRRLTLPISKRIFRFLDKRFYHKKTWDFPLREFSENKVGMQPYRFESKIKEKLAPAIRELEEQGIIVPEKRYSRIGKGEYQIHFKKGSYIQRPHILSGQSRGAKPSEQPTEPKLGTLEQELSARGVTPKEASRLVAQFDKSLIERQIEHFDFVKSQGTFDSESANPGGWLRSAIVGDYPLPEGMKVKEEKVKRSQKERMEAEQRDKKFREEKAKRVRKQEEREATVRAYLEALTSEEREALVEKAFSKASAFERSYLEKDPEAQTTKEMKAYVLQRYVLSILGGPSDDPGSDFA